MEKIIAGLVTKIADIALQSRVRDDDFVDQMNHWATTGLLTALALGVGAKQYVGDPIHCWVPAEYKSKHFQKYSDSYCWIYPMYSLPFEDPIAVNPEDRWMNDVGYYRWVFIMFLLQAFLFKFPNILWNHMKNASGLNVGKLVTMAADTHFLTQEKRDEQMDHIAIFIDHWLKTYSHYKFSVLTRFRDKFSRVMFCFGRHAGTYLSGLCLFVKLLYLINIIGQFFMMSAFFDLNFWAYGTSAIRVFNKHGQWQDHYNFPRIGLCDYKVRQLQNVQTFTVQCVLSINMFLEKIFLILWFWMLLLLILNTINVAQWLFNSLRPHSGETFLKKYLLLLDVDSQAHKKMFVKFVKTYLRADGIFLLRIVQTNTSEILVIDLIKHIWMKFSESDGVADDTDGNVIPSAPDLDNANSDLPPKKVK